MALSERRYVIRLTAARPTVYQMPQEHWRGGYPARTAAKNANSISVRFHSRLNTNQTLISLGEYYPVASSEASTMVKHDQRLYKNSLTLD
jgi:hypothetical protein